jgi:hypothetical protein
MRHEGILPIRGGQPGIYLATIRLALFLLYANASVPSIRGTARLYA